MRTPDAIRRALGENAALLARAKAQDSKIRAAAAEELDRVNERLSGLTSGDVMTDEVKAHEYMRLVEDRAHMLRLTGG